jgi:hypothetical protein
MGLIAGAMLIFLTYEGFELIANVRMARQSGSRAWLSGIAARSTGIALVVLCIEVDENPSTRNHLWILVGMIVASLAIEIVKRRSSGAHMGLLGPDASSDAAPVHDKALAESSPADHATATGIVCWPFRGKIRRAHGRTKKILLRT